MRRIFYCQLSKLLVQKLKCLQNKSCISQSFWNLMKERVSEREEKKLRNVENNLQGHLTPHALKDEIQEIF